MPINCDPATLANSARCFNCVIPVGDQLAVQSYALAKLVGYATDSDGANQLANDARCFSCTIPPGDLLQVQTYLISLISETTIAASDLPNAARCFMSCVPLGEQNALKSYLLDQVASLGGITISTDPAVLVNDARCVSCVVPIGDQTAVQTWMLALLANVDTTDPSGIANAARCYASCIPIGDQIPVQNYLLCQTQAIVTPPCVTPGSAFQVGVGTRGTTDTSTQLGVRWLQQNNTGSLITSYTVKWGTTAGGPYTFNSGPIPINPKFYLATGLTAGTTYYFIVVANSFAGCSSANSAEASATTSGAPPTNGLLNGLVSYWHLAAGPSPDVQDGNPLTLTGGTINGAGGAIANGPYVGFTGALNEGFAVTPAPANLRLGAGKSFGVSIWIKPDVVQPNAQSDILSQYSGAFLTSAYLLDIAAVTLTLHGYSAASTQAAINIGAQPSNAWHHIVIGFDSPNQILYAQLDAGVRQTQALTDLPSTVTAIEIGSDASANVNAFSGGMNEAGFWNRVLSATDVTNLYNGGAGLPFSSFQA